MECFDFSDRRSLAAQQRARQKEVLAQTKSMQNSISVGRKALQVKAAYQAGSPSIHLFSKMTTHEK